MGSILTIQMSFKSNEKAWKEITYTHGQTHTLTLYVVPFWRSVKVSKRPKRIPYIF